MRKYFLLALSGVKKAKGQTAALLVVLLFAAAVFQMGLITATDYQKNFDRRAALTDAEDVVYSYQTRDQARIGEFKAIIEGDDRTQKLEITPSLCHNISFVYGTGEMNMHNVIFPVDVERAMGQFRFVERVNAPGTQAVYLPLLFKTGGGYRMGDNFRVQIKTQTFDYTVSGFYENTLIGSFNTGICSFLLSPDAFAALDAKTDIQGVLLSVRLKEGVSDADYVSSTGNRLNAIAQDLVGNSTYYTMARSMRTLTATVCSMIFIGIAALIVVIALVITAFRIANNIEQDMKSYGALQAVGWTGRQIVRSILLQFLLVGLAAVLGGTALAYALLPLENALLIMQTGVIWAYRFSIASLFIVLGVILGTIALTAFLTARRLKRLTPITALRQGVETHSFKRNPLPLEKARGPVVLTLALKSFCRGMKQNAAAFIIVAAVAFATVFMSVMLQSFVIDNSVAMGFLAGEQADAALYTLTEDADSVYRALGAREEVERVYRYQTLRAMLDDTQLVNYVVDNCDNLNTPQTLYDGAFPRYENEVALGGLLAKKRNIRIGDIVRLGVGERQADYLVTGFIQSSNNMGNECMMLDSGYLRIADAMQGGFYIILKPGYDINRFIASALAEFGDTIIVNINIREVINGAMGIYTVIVAMLVLVLSAVLLGVIALVLGLLVKAMLIRRRKEYGIQKALGYTTGQLTLQTAVAFLPTVLLGVAIGIGAGAAATNPLLTLLFSGIGIAKAMFPVPPGLIALFGLGVAAFAMGTALLMSLRVKRIAPLSLLNRE